MKETGAPCVAFITMGCAKNEVDTIHMGDALREAGYRIEDDPADADVVVVNTCSFIQAATEESIEAILDAAELPRVKYGDAKLVVSGCMPSRYGADLEAELPEVASFVACADEEDIVDVVERLVGKPVGTDVQADERAFPYAYVKISDGCDRFCSYCTIPYIRGRYHSFTEESIVSEIETDIARGAREIVLIGQDTGRWGDDFPEKSSLAELVKHLAERFPDVWFRVMYIQPEGVTDELIDVVATHENVCDYFDIPFQHCNGDVIERMNRKGNEDEYRELISRIRARIPQCAIRTTLMAGFPGETEEQFDELCAFVDDADLDYIGVFAYSREDGTVASKLDGQIDDEEKAYRAQKLRDVADAACMPRVSERVGNVEDVLVCGREEDGQLYGRTMGQAPEVDGVTYLDRGEVGTIVSATIVDALLYEMEGEVRS